MGQWALVLGSQWEPTSQKKNHKRSVPYNPIYFQAVPGSNSTHNSEGRAHISHPHSSLSKKQIESTEHKIVQFVAHEIPEEWLKIQHVHLFPPLKMLK